MVLAMARTFLHGVLYVVMHSLNITAYNLENPKRKKQTDNSSPVD